jgi:hypothetical protein
MKDFHRRTTDRSEGADPAVTSLLRAAYSPPRDERYWHALEQRVMHAIHESPAITWWAVLSEWKTAGAIAATLALLLAGATISDLTGARTREVVAETLIDSGIPLDDATFSFRIGKRLPADAPERYLDPFDY